MNFVNGKIISNAECDEIMENLEDLIMQTLAKPPLDIDLVIRACDTVVKNIHSSNILRRLPEFGISQSLACNYTRQIVETLNGDAIRERLRIELGADYPKPRTIVYSATNATAVQKTYPLGVLFHITAGNVDALPFLSLLDGLLTGNINIVKLPKEERGITVALLEELFRVEPSLCEYVYVFDFSSKDLQSMKKLMVLANAVVIWGGDEAVSSVRKTAEPNTKIIEWGHKISFAYATKNGGTQAALEKLALHICTTNQVFCNSCQGIFLDTDDMQDVYNFCEKFLPIFEATCADHPFEFSAAEKLFIQAEITLQNYHKRIENRGGEKRLFIEKNCSIEASNDSKPETSVMYRNIWVKPLLRSEIIKLRSYKGYLQTAALLAAEDEYDELAQMLLQIGIVKVSDGYEMSNNAFGEAHDGMFPLRCYTKLVSVQN